MTLSIDAIDVAAAVLPPPDLDLLSTNSLEGTGAFDVLMQTTKLHLKEEYNEGRITGEEYSTVYLGAMTAVLQQAVQYLSNHQQEEKVLAEIGLIRQQTVTELAQTDDTLPTGLGFNGDSNVEGLVKSKKDLDALQADLVNAQITKSTRDGVLVGQQIITELAQTDSNIGVAAATYGLNDTGDILGIAKAQQDKIAAETDLVIQQTVTEVSQTSDSKPISLGHIASTEITGISKAQKDKIAADISKALAEEDLLVQKTVTEVAQTSNTKPMTLGQMSDTVVIEGLVQLQKDRTAAEVSKMTWDEGLITQKIVTELAQTSDTKPILLGAMPTAAIDGLMKLQREQSAAVISKLGVEEDLLTQQIVTEVAQTSDIKPMTLGQMTATTAITGLISSQKEKTDQEIANMLIEGNLLTQKIVTEVAQTSDTKPTSLGQMNTVTAINGLAKAQKDKLAGEVILLAQKAITELAQTSDTLDITTDALNTNIATTGVIAKQKDLFAAQTDGFARDAEQKLAKMLIDAWSVARTTDPDNTHRPAGIGDTMLGDVMTIAKTGIS